MSESIASGVEVAGPSVQTIFVRGRWFVGTSVR